MNQGGQKLRRKGKEEAKGEAMASIELIRDFNRFFKAVQYLKRLSSCSTVLEENVCGIWYGNRDMMYTKYVSVWQ